MFLFIFSTLENSSNSEPEKDLKCFFSEMYEFLFLNEFEEIAAKYKMDFYPIGRLSGTERKSSNFVQSLQHD